MINYLKSNKGNVMSNLAIIGITLVALCCLIALHAPTWICFVIFMTMLFAIRSFINESTKKR